MSSATLVSAAAPGPSEGPFGRVIYHRDLVPGTELQRRLLGLMTVDNRLGDATRGWFLCGLSAAAVAEAAGTQHPNWVTNKTWTIDAVLRGRLRTAPTCIRAVLEDLGGLERRGRGDREVLRHLRRVRAALLSGESQDSSEGATDLVVPGGLIYVALQPTYFQLQSLVKVGYTAADTPFARMASFRATGSPEPHLLARLYKPGDWPASTMERRLHRCLREAGCGWHEPGAGREFFRASLPVIDSVAAQLGGVRIPARDEETVERLLLEPSTVLRLASNGAPVALQGLRVAAPVNIGKPATDEEDR